MKIIRKKIRKENSIILENQVSSFHFIFFWFSKLLWFSSTTIFFHNLVYLSFYYFPALSDKGPKGFKLFLHYLKEFGTFMCWPIITKERLGNAFTGVVVNVVPNHWFSSYSRDLGTTWRLTDHYQESISREFIGNSRTWPHHRGPNIHFLSFFWGPTVRSGYLSLLLCFWGAW